MNYKIGLVGLPNIGKTTLFTILTKQKALIANFPFATIEPNKGIVYFEDSRLENLQKIWNSKKKTNISFELIDIAGLVKGASEGLGLGNSFLSAIKEVNLIFHVIRCFSDLKIIHIEQRVNPLLDLQLINLEMSLSDLQQIEKKLEQKKTLNNLEEITFLKKIKEKLKQNIFLSTLEFTKEEKIFLKNLNLLTNKPIIIVANCNCLETPPLFFLNYLKEKNFPLIFLDFKTEEEILQLSEKEIKELKIFSKKKIFEEQILNLINEQLKTKIFFTAGEKEVRSWITKKEETAKNSAGLIHSDLIKNFICLQVYNYKDWIKNPDEEKLKKEGKIYRKNSDYLIKEGDICFFVCNKNKQKQ